MPRTHLFTKRVCLPTSKDCLGSKFIPDTLLSNLQGFQHSFASINRSLIKVCVYCYGFLQLCNEAFIVKDVALREIN